MFSKAINWNKYLSKVSINRPNQYFDYAINRSFLGANRLFVSSFEKKLQVIRLPTLEIKDCNVMIDGQNVFDQPVKNDLKTYVNNQKIANVKEIIIQLVVYYLN